MSKLWGGRFTEETDRRVFEFNSSIRFDKRLFEEDIEGSIAHCIMLEKIGVISLKDKNDILYGLAAIRDEVTSGILHITDEYEDIHSFVEANLIKKIGDAGKKLHTGRSRNDQVALDMRLYIRNVIIDISEELLQLMDSLNTIMCNNLRTYMPGFTHLQKAQPTTLAHYMGAYYEMFKRDRSRLEDVFDRMNICPLGCGALAGTTYPLDRYYTASMLGFEEPCNNSMDGVSDRDYIIELLSTASIIMMHLSRLSEEIIIWNSDEYRFIIIDDRYSTGSSIMPQKKNPDVAELIRGKTGRVYGSLVALLTTFKGLPLAYNKDMQEDKECTFDACDTVLDCIGLMKEMLDTIRINEEVMSRSAMRGFTNATDVADYLVRKGIAFRDAHEIVGRLVLYSIDKEVDIEEISITELKSISDAFDMDIYDEISLESCVYNRITLGGPSPDVMEDIIDNNREYLSNHRRLNIENLVK